MSFIDSIHSIIPHGLFAIQQAEASLRRHSAPHRAEFYKHAPPTIFCGSDESQPNL